MESRDLRFPNEKGIPRLDIRDSALRFKTILPQDLRAFRRTMNMQRRCIRRPGGKNPGDRLRVKVINMRVRDKEIRQIIRIYAEAVQIECRSHPGIQQDMTVQKRTGTAEDTGLADILPIMIGGAGADKMQQTAHLKITAPV